MSFSLDLKKLAAKFDIKVDDSAEYLKDLKLELRKIGESFNVKVNDLTVSPGTVDDVKLYKCMKQILMHEDTNLLVEPTDKIELESFCNEFDTKISKLLDDVGELERLREATSRLQAEFDSKQKCYLGLKEQYDDFYERILSPYEKLKEELDRAIVNYNDEVARSVAVFDVAFSNQLLIFT